MKRYISVVLFSVFLSLFGAETAYAAGDWPHYDLSTFASPYRFDMANRPETNLIGMALFYIPSSGDTMLRYSEYDKGLGTSSYVDVCPMAAGESISAAMDVAIAYADMNHVGIAYTIKANDGVTGIRTELRYVDGVYTSGTGWQWTQSGALDTEFYDYHYPTGANFLGIFGFLRVDLAFDQRAEYAGAAHIAYSAFWIHYEGVGSLGYTYNGVFMAYNSNVVDSYNDPNCGWQVRASAADDIADPWIIEALPPTNGAASDVGCAPSLATSTNAPPQIALDDSRMATDTPIILYARWSDVNGWEADATPILWGKWPSLALDPDTAQPRIALSGTEDGVYFSSSEDDGVTWAWYQVVDADSRRFPALSIADDAQGNPVMKVVALRDDGSIYASKYVSSAWSSMGCVAHDSNTLYPRILVEPLSSADPWVLCAFNGADLCLGWKGTPVGCGTVPLGRESGYGQSGWLALLPMGIALSALLGWRFWRKKNSAQA